MCLCVSPVASFTFYLADSEIPELTSPTGSEDDIISFAYLDTLDSHTSGTGPEDELGALIISDVTSDGFHLSWEPKADVVYDSYTVESRDTLGLWDVEEVHLSGDATGSRIQGLKASTEYRIKLYGLTGSQRSALLETVAVTGISLFFWIACQPETLCSGVKIKIISRKRK